MAQKSPRQMSLPKHLRNAWRELAILGLAVAVAVAWEVGGIATAPVPPAASPSGGAGVVELRDAWPSADATPPPPAMRLVEPELRAAWAQGVRDADADLRAGTPHLRVHGFRDEAAPAVDPETGLPLQATGERADVSARAFDEGYRARVLQYIRLRGVPSVSRKPWIQDIVRPEAYFARAGRAEALIAGRVVRSPDGSVAVERSDGKPSSVTVRAGGRMWVHPLAGLEPGGTLDVLFGPAGSRTVFLRYSDGDAQAHVVVATDMGWRINVSMVYPRKTDVKEPRR